MNLPGLANEAAVRDALSINPEAGKILSDFHEQVLHGDSPLPIATRELIAAYVSGLNNCLYCHETHKAVATHLGVSAEAIEDLL